jgi:hypothetical protein
MLDQKGRVMTKFPLSLIVKPMVASSKKQEGFIADVGYENRKR